MSTFFTIFIISTTYIAFSFVIMIVVLVAYKQCMLPPPHAVTSQSILDDSIALLIPNG